MNYREMIMGSKTLDIFLFKFEVFLKVNLLTHINEIKLNDINIFHYDQEAINITIKNKNKIWFC